MAKAESDLSEYNMENPRLDRPILIARPLSVLGGGGGVPQNLQRQRSNHKAAHFCEEGIDVQLVPVDKGGA